MALTVTLQEYVRSRSEKVYRALDEYVCARRFGSAPSVLIEAMRYSLLGGGKMFRPMLVVAAAEFCDGDMDVVLPAACAVEMLHTFSLIHDDLPTMDDSDTRRGRMTNHKVFGEAVAILAGDSLLGLSFQILAEAAKDPRVGPNKAIKVILEMARAAGVEGMAGGQVLDLVAEGQATELTDVERIHRLKTGAFLTACLRMGAIMVGGKGSHLTALDRYAGHLGLAFQVYDDVLDVVGDPAKTGKPVAGDLRHDKATYVRAYGVEGARQIAMKGADAAVQVVAPYGSKANMLQELAWYVVKREG